jgi:hypothetical protein
MGGGYSGWDSFVLKYGGEVFLERRIIFLKITVLWYGISYSVIEYWRRFDATCSCATSHTAIQYLSQTLVERSNL